MIIGQTVSERVWMQSTDIRFVLCTPAYIANPHNDISSDFSKFFTFCMFCKMRLFISFLRMIWAIANVENNFCGTTYLSCKGRRNTVQLKEGKAIE